MSWWEVFKLKQINIGTTKLSDKEIPEEEEDNRDCCEEARIKYMIEVGKYIIRGLKRYVEQGYGLQGPPFSKDSRFTILVGRHGPDWRTKFDENNDGDCIQAYEEEHGGTGIAQKRGDFMNLNREFNCDYFRERLEKCRCSIKVMGGM